MHCILVPPETDSKPILSHENTKTLLREDLTGPYLENVPENFTCSIRNVLPGKDSTSFSFYSSGKLILQSKNGTGEVIEMDENDGTKFVEWKFSTIFSRNDNGGNFSCNMDWEAGQYKISGVHSEVTQHVNVKCKYVSIYNRTCFI